jgi:hypothetical protein
MSVALHEHERNRMRILFLATPSWCPAVNQVVEMTGELSASVSLAGEISVAPGRGARTIRIRAALRAMWPAEFLDGSKVAYLGKAGGEREKGSYPKGFHGWPLERRNAWFAGFNAGRIARTRQQGRATK